MGNLTISDGLLGGPPGEVLVFPLGQSEVVPDEVLPCVLSAAPLSLCRAALASFVDGSPAAL
jgi:hypothetical protein